MIYTIIIGLIAIASAITFLSLYAEEKKNRAEQRRFDSMKDAFTARFGSAAAASMLREAVIAGCSFNELTQMMRSRLEADDRGSAFAPPMIIRR